MSNPETKGKTRKIVIPIIITLFGTAVATWYTINRGEKQATLAELERARNVKSNLVTIIEEHIINQKPIDYGRIVRLIEIKSQEENLNTVISVRSLIGKAEYNILNSRYLDFKQKEEYKAIFDQLYKNMIPDEYASYEEIPNADLLNILVQNIREQKTEDSLNMLGQIVLSWNSQLSELEKKASQSTGFLGITEDPKFLVYFIGYFFGITMMLFFLMRVMRRKRFRELIRRSVISKD